MEDRLMNIGMMATYPPRFESLKATLKTLFPQLDMLFLSPNDYTLDLHHQQISTVHGRVIVVKPLTDYFKDTRSFNYKTELHHLQQVHIAGTGTCAFKMDLIPFRPSEKELKEYRGMSDIWFAVKANMNRIGIYAVPRSAGWMKDTDESKSLDTLYREYSKDTSKHCKILNKLEWL